MASEKARINQRIELVLRDKYGRIKAKKIVTEKNGKRTEKDEEVR